MTATATARAAANAANAVAEVSKCIQQHEADADMARWLAAKAYIDAPIAKRTQPNYRSFPQGGRLNLTAFTSSGPTPSPAPRAAADCPAGPSRSGSRRLRSAYPPAG
jgi:hypothetical protein